MSKSKNTAAVAEQVVTHGTPPRTRARDLIYAWFKSLDFKSKLAVVIATDFLSDDHGGGTADMMNTLLNQFGKEIIAETEHPSNKLEGMDRTAAGMAFELLMSRQNS